MMKGFIQKFKRGLIATIVFMVAFGLTLSATSRQDAEAGWYPGRDIKTYVKGIAGFDHPTFNSFKGTLTYGDERTFHTATTTDAPKNYRDTLKVKPGDTVILRTYFHNGADPKFNDSGKGVAKNSRIKMYVPATSGTKFKSYSYISADNARYENDGAMVKYKGDPVVTVYDSADMASDVPVKLKFVKGSAKLYNNAFTFAEGGKSLPDSIVFTSGSVDPTKSYGGAELGYGALNGRVPGCFEFEGWVFIKVKVVGESTPQEKPGLKVIKKVKEVGGSAWFDANDTDSAVSTSPGKTVSYLIRFENTGNVKLHDVIVRDVLPSHVSYVSGSTKFIDANNPDPGKSMPDGIVNGGLDMGHFGPGAVGYLRFNAKVKNSFPEGTHVMKNIAVAKADEVGEKKDPAVIKVTVGGVEPGGIVIEKAKSAFNESQGIDATLTTNRPGDLITYTLITKNSGGDTATGFIVEDDLSDVLEYSLVTDLGGGVMNGSTIKYPATDISPNEIVTNTFKVKVKPANEWPNGGDKELENTYGNDVVVPVGPFGSTTPAGSVKPKGGVQTLPATGPEDWLPVLGIFTMLTLSYFHWKSKRDLAYAVNTKTWN